jgi:hypothetical protein
MMQTKPNFHWFNNMNSFFLLLKGSQIFYVPQYSAYVLPQLLYQKGSDASGEFDEEPPPEVLLKERISNCRKSNIQMTKKNREPNRK